MLKKRHLFFTPFTSLSLVCTSGFFLIFLTDYLFLKSAVSTRTIFGVGLLNGIILLVVITGVVVRLRARKNGLNQVRLLHEVQGIIQAAHHLSEISQKAYQLAFSKASELEEITAVMDQFTSQINGIAKNTNHANQFAMEMLDSTRAGVSQMDDMIIAITNISDASHKLAQMIKTIDKIASQTHILALNATIEASRAGKHGMAFAVVAKEVRNLAARSTDNARESTDLVESTLKRLDAGNLISAKTLEALHHIKTEVDKVTGMIEGISVSANEQVRSITDFNDNISKISRLTQSQKSEAKEVTDLSEELSRRVGELQREIVGATTSGAPQLSNRLPVDSKYAPSTRKNRPFRFVFDPFPPLTFTEGNENKGIFIDICKEILEKRMGVAMEYQEMDWDTCQSMVREGRHDGFFTTPTPERRTYLETHITTAYSFDWVLWTYANHPRLKQIHKIRRVEDIKTIGFTLATYPGNGWVKTNIEKVGIKVIYIKNEFQALADKKADLIVEEPLVGYQKIRQSGIPEGEVGPTQAILRSTPFQLLIGKHSPYVDILPQFDRELRKIKTDGSLEKMITTYR